MEPDHAAAKIRRANIENAEAPKPRASEQEAEIAQNCAKASAISASRHCSLCGQQMLATDWADRLITERDLLRERERALVMERDQQERFKWAGNKRIEELAAVLKQVADRLSAWRDGAHIAFNASGSDEQYNLRGNYDGLLSAIEAVMVETTTPHVR